MKNKTTFLGKIVILAIILVAGNLKVSAQYQSIFGQTHTSWNCLGATISSNIFTDSLTIVGDTVINSTAYKVGHHYKFSTYEYPLQLNTSEFSFLREDTTQGKVWYYMSYDSSETLVMDLSLGIGDTFHVFGQDILVDSVYFVGGKKYVRVNISSSLVTGGQAEQEKFLMIEGMGTNYGVNPSAWGSGYNVFLLCAHKDAMVTYTNSNGIYSGYCSTHVLGADDLLENLKLSISPNPFSSVLNLSYELETVADVELSLYDILGKKYDLPELSAQSGERSAGVHALSVNTASLPSGTYFLRIRVGDDVEHRKLVKL